MEPMHLPVAESIEIISSGCNTGATLTPKEKRKALRKRLPPWFKTALPTGDAQDRFNATKSTIEIFPSRRRIESVFPTDTRSTSPSRAD